MDIVIVSTPGNPVRVLHIITQLELGGAQQTTLELLRRLDARRYQLTLVAAPGGPLELEARTIPGLEVHGVPSLVRPLNPWRDVLAVRDLTRFIRTRRFDIVHTHSSKAGILGRWAAHLARTPVICHTIHGFAFHPYQPAGIRQAYQAAERAAARITTRLITVSRHDERAARAVGIGRPGQHQYIPYGVDLGRFHSNGLTPQSARERLGLRTEAPTIGTIACFKPQKALQDFLAVCALVRKAVPDLQAVLVGDGRLRPQIERWRRALDLEDVVHLLGWQRDIPTVLTAFDVFVLCSRWEGLPVSVLEAQAMGLPVVVTDTGGVRDCIEDGVTGCLVPVGDVDGMSRRIVKLLRDGELARTVTKRSVAQVAERFTVDRMVKETETMYAAALHETGEGGT